VLSSLQSSVVATSPQSDRSDRIVSYDANPGVTGTVVKNHVVAEMLLRKEQSYISET
jgi:hypothetical protein